MNSKLWKRLFVNALLINFWAFSARADAPVLNCTGLDITISCTTSLSEAPRPSVTTDCGDVSQVTTTSEDDTNNLSACGGTGYIIRTWTATDICGETATCVQTITITNAAPVLNCNNLDVTVSCVDYNSGNNLPKPAGTDDCTPQNSLQLTYVDNISGINNCQGTILRTWTATDACGLTSTCVQTIILIEDDKLVVDCNIGDEVFECDGKTGFDSGAELWNQRNFRLLLDCAKSGCGDIRISVKRLGGTLSDDCGQTGSITVEYTITDGCNNRTNKYGRFTVVDNTPPTIKLVCNPQDLTFDCNGSDENRAIAIQWNSDNIAKLQAATCIKDICNSIVFTVTSDFDVNQLNLNCEGRSDLVITYTITDVCDNFITRAANITNKVDISNSICERISYETTSNILAIDSIIASNPIVKIFDPNWQIIYNCSGDCPETINIPDVLEGETYHTDIQLYDENWQFICEDKRDLVIEDGGEPCDTSICAGDVILRTQAEVDAFCGCEVIEGNLVIREEIFSIENLKNLKKVNGTISIKNTLLKTLTPLSNLEFVGGQFRISINHKLENIHGLENLKNIKSYLSLNGNNLLTSIDDFRKLEFVGGIVLSVLPISSIEVFKNLKNTKLEILHINGCDNLESLDGLSHIDTITGDSVGNGININSNDNLKNIDALGNIELVQGNFILFKNLQLQNCCAISDLVDANLNNGFVSGQIDIRLNPQFCNSPEAILQNCQTPPPTCEDIEIKTENNRIILTNLIAPNQIIKVFDESYNIVYQCTANCQEKQQLASAFPDGYYIVDIQLYDENWQNICFEQRPVVLDNSNTNPCFSNDCETIPPVLSNVPADITVNRQDIPSASQVTATDNCDADVEITFSDEETVNDDVLVRTYTATDNCGNTASIQQIITIIADNIACETISITTKNNQIILSNITTPNTIAKVFDPNWQLIYDCTATCENKIVVPVENEGVYHTDVQLYDENWEFICEDRQDIEVIETSEPCDTSMCQGDVILSTQAEVDAFCGCEVIEGNLTVGNTNGTEVDINDLSNLGNLKIVKGALGILGTRISNLKGLEQLSKIGKTFYFYRNHLVKSFEGCENLKRIGGAFRIDANDSLESLNGLSSLDSLPSIHIIGNKALQKIDGLDNLRILGGLGLSGSQIENLDLIRQIENTIVSITITGSTKVKNLEGLERFDTLGGLFLGGNRVLDDISAIKDVDYITGNLVIEQNRELENCCIIKHLLSEGNRVGGRISVGSNKSDSSCDNPIRFEQQCLEPPTLCEYIGIVTENDLIRISGLSPSNDIVKVFDKNYNIIFECFADCVGPIEVNNLAVGIYHININYYDVNWQPICEHNESIEIKDTIQSRNSELLLTDFTLFPNPAKAETFIDLSKLKGEEVTLYLYNQFGQQVWAKPIEQVQQSRARIDLSTFQNGLYFLKVQTQSRKLIAKKLMISRLY